MNELTRKQIKEVKKTAYEDFIQLVDDPDLIGDLCDMAQAHLDSRQQQGGRVEALEDEELRKANNLINALFNDKEDSTMVSVSPPDDYCSRCKRTGFELFLVEYKPGYGDGSVLANSVCRDCRQQIRNAVEILIKDTLPPSQGAGEGVRLAIEALERIKNAQKPENGTQGIKSALAFIKIAGRTLAQLKGLNHG